MIKIDVDGSEGKVIEGAIETLRRARPVLFLEVHFLGRPPYSELRARLVELLRDLPYRYDSAATTAGRTAPSSPSHTSNPRPNTRTSASTTTTTC